MEYQKITNLLGNTCDKVPRFITKKWIEVHEQIRFKTSMLRSDLCDYRDPYIAVRGIIAVSATDGANNIKEKKNRPLAFKNNAPFISCISKINGVLIENAENLDIVMPMYSLLEYSKNYSKTAGSLWNYYRDELADKTNDDNDPNKNVINSMFFKYKTSITESTYNVAATATVHDTNEESTKKDEVTVPLKHLSNFWKTRDIPLINCEVSLASSWSVNCVITNLRKKISNSCTRR